MESTPFNITKGGLYNLDHRILKSYKPPFLFIELDSELNTMYFTIYSKTKYECVRIVRSRIKELKQYNLKLQLI